MGEKNTQFFDWGEIEWVYEPNSSNELNVMSIGLVTIFPGKRQNKHIHYGEEQLIYVLSGKGKQFIGDKVSTKEPGCIYHIEAGSIHESINSGDEPIKELLISIPVYYEQNPLIQNKIQHIFKSTKMYEESIDLNHEIKYIYESFEKSLKIPVTIFDAKGMAVIVSKEYPQYCKKRCKIDENIYNCDSYKQEDEYNSPRNKEVCGIICPYGLTIFCISIFINNHIIGYLKGGHIKTSQKDVQINRKIKDMSYERMEIVPKGRINAILQQMKKLSKNITSYYMLKNTSIELQASLKSTQEEMLSIQINNHFLFNTLNAIASLALKENSFETYHAIIYLSKIFRYTLKNTNSVVTLKEEITYLINYINLQKLRYKDRLIVDFNICKDVENKHVPFNCLQPIVENSFIHGFKDIKKNMRMEIMAKMNKNNLIIEIKDNGIGMEEEVLNKLMLQIKEHREFQYSGLMMVYRKLELFFSSEFELEMISSKTKGTKVRITLGGLG